MYICTTLKRSDVAALKKVRVMATYSVFYLVGGSVNFVCKSLVGKFTWDAAKSEVESLNRMGYKAMAVKDGHIVGGYQSFSDFDSPEAAKEYYTNL